MGKAPDTSLRRRLLLRLWIPLSGLLIVGALLTFRLAAHLGNGIHDEWLLDSAMALATQLRANEAGPQLSLSPSAVEIFEWDAVDRIYSEVTSATKGRLFGNFDFPRPPVSLTPNQPYFYDGRVADHDVRIVAISVTNPSEPSAAAVIQVAETKQKRKALVWEIILLLVPLQAGILIVAGASIWFAVTSSLKSLDGIATRLRKYQPNSLVPLDEVSTAPSEVKPLLLAINKLLERVSEAQGVQQRFVANASHQLRTPLAALQVQTERALRETDPDRHAQALTHVLIAVTRMRHLTQQLLTLTRSDASSAAILAMREIDLAQFAREQLEEWLDRAIELKIDLGYDGPEKGVMIRAEPQLLAALLGNLVDNALRYNRPGGTVTVIVRASPILLCVEDDGLGIPPSELEQVFEPFYRMPRSGTDGCGLGLAIAREISARHGARLEIAVDAPRSGTRVNVWFSASATDNAAEANVDEAQTPMGAREHLPS